MVLSASMITSCGRRLVVCRTSTRRVAGIGAGAFIASRLTVMVEASGRLPAAAMVLQALVFVPVLGSKGGNRNWLKLTSTLSLQPSELTKIGLAPGRSSRQQAGPLSGLHAAPYLVPVAAITIGLVRAGHTRDRAGSHRSSER
jgi:cell division protein FtsW (lipid II flippase)